MKLTFLCQFLRSEMSRPPTHRGLLPWFRVACAKRRENATKNSLICVRAGVRDIYIMGMQSVPNSLMLLNKFVGCSLHF